MPERPQRVPAPVAAVRRAVRDALGEVAAEVPGGLVLVASSGGADSLALADATLHEAPALGLRVGLVTVDHGLQEGSGERAAVLASWARARGFDPVETIAVAVDRRGGPEAAARAARYAALDAAAARLAAAAVLLGHTRDDQAETVLLALARGSGARSLAGMVRRRGPYLRPLLDVERATTRAACVAVGLVPWRDPHNADPRFARARVRELLPRLEQAAGPGVVAALARSAALVRSDVEALDQLAADAAGRVTDAEGHLDVTALRQLLPAVRSRVLHAAAVRAGAPGGALAAVHVAAMDALVVRWRGQGPVSLPGGLECRRASGSLVFAAAPARPVRGVPRTPAPPPGDGRVSDGGAGHLHGMPAGQDGSRVEERVDGDVAATRGARPPGLPADAWYADDIERVLLSREQVDQRIAELAEELRRDYGDRELMLVAVLKGAVMFVADLGRALHQSVEMEFMAVSSYGSATTSSGVVRILKDLETDIAGRHVILVEDIVDSGLTLSWLLKNLASRNPASLEVVALLRKVEAARVHVDVKYVGFDIPNEFVVGYGLDYAQRYRALPFVGTLRPRVYLPEQ